MKMASVQKFYHIEPKNIYWLRFIIEACDGIASVTTIDPKTGIVVVYIPPGCENDAEMVLQGLQEEIQLEAVYNMSPFYEV